MRLLKATNLAPLYLFIAPPTFEDLQKRLVGRGTETPEAISKRLATAIKEIQYAKEPGVHDVVVINDDVERAYDLFRRVALGETVEGDPMPDLVLPHD